MPSVEKISTSQFVNRISKYLRSIGQYGDNPMLMANYGSSEYAQSLSRVGSIFGNIFVIASLDWTINDVDLEQKSVKLSNCENPIFAKKGIIAS